MRLAGRVLLAGALALTSATSAAAQRVRFELSDTLINAQGARWPEVRTPDLLQDSRWRGALQNSFPVRLRFRIEIWRVRPDWFDALERSFEWETLIQFEPLTDQYSKTVIFGNSARGFTRFTSLQDLQRNLELPQVVRIAPAGIGEYYFTGTLEIQTLTDQEMEELERFLQGEPSPREQQDDPGSSLGRSARRLLLRFGGLPYQSLEARSARFEVQAP